MTDNLPGRIEAVEREVAHLREEWAQDITRACNAVRTHAESDVRSLETRIDMRLGALQARLDWGLVLLAGILVAVGVIAVMQPLAASEPPVYVSTENRVDALVGVLDQLDPADPAHWTGAGLPRIDVLERGLSGRLGYPVRVTRAERHLAMVIARHRSGTDE